MLQNQLSKIPPPTLFRKQQFQRRNQIAASSASQVAHKQPKTTSRQIMLFFQFTIDKYARVIVDRPIRKKNAHSSDWRYDSKIIHTRERVDCSTKCGEH